MVGRGAKTLTTGDNDTKEQIFLCVPGVLGEWPPESARFRRAPRGRRAFFLQQRFAAQSNLPVGSMLITLTMICSPSLSSSRTSFTR